ncbi:MYXO-CTERM domain-containing protein [Mycobacterium frederiksbergense]|uniref:MYXO-CTERM domain-containing protein n=1 Tax=Mycolicibacterium frederiksbergense TaxID=117567 RepID=A0ABT6KSD7_9MYCO|nr:MYXO-CTERM domain-containing protein [Mycolicibacterium frederiksbergense]
MSFPQPAFPPVTPPGIGLAVLIVVATVWLTRRRATPRW